MKKIFTVIGVLSLVCFSFYYTNLATEIIKNNDPIMKKIVKVSESYKKESINAVFSDNTIIPGISGVKVDINNSYESMKKYGKFNEDLIVFEEIMPTVSVQNTFDKYIRRGNVTKTNVSIIIIVDDPSYVENILDILNSKEVKVTFFVGKNIINESMDLIDIIIKSGHRVEYKSDEYNVDEVLKYNNLLKVKTNNNLKFCYTDEENITILSNCNYKKMHTIFPNIITTNFPYSDVKRNLDSGSILSFKSNQHTLRELKYIINYINQKGFTIVNLDQVISE